MGQNSDKWKMFQKIFLKNCCLYVHFFYNYDKAEKWRSTLVYGLRASPVWWKRVRYSWRNVPWSRVRDGIWADYVEDRVKGKSVRKAIFPGSKVATRLDRPLSSGWRTFFWFREEELCGNGSEGKNRICIYKEYKNKIDKLKGIEKTWTRKTSRK